MAEAANKDDYIKNPPELNGVPDLSLLVYMEMPNVLDVLEHRWLAKGGRKEMYTSISTILIAVNPYEYVKGIYSSEMVDHFYAQAQKGVTHMKPPHPYGCGARSYNRMMGRKKNQSVIVCGESGAGKTETTKQVIKYLADTTPGSGENSGTIEMQIIAASPVLEAFGNAKTVLNNNSSRFGKFTKVLYSADGDHGVVKGAIVGATLETYLLEKSRVIFQADKERNYHSFYFIWHGLSPEQRTEFGVEGGMMDFFYTKQGGSAEVDGINDLARFEELQQSLNTYRMTAENQLDLYKAVMGIAHLGNVNFSNDDQGFGECDGASMKHVEYCAKLFGIDAKALKKRLETSSLKVGKKTIQKRINFQDSPANRDAISKGLYEKIFLYLAKRINDDLSQIDEEAAEYLFIGILDVFGFENFKVNSLEQFCINFTNEKLQNFFNKNIIESEQEEYLRESVLWTEIDVPNSQPMMDLVEDPKKGMFTILDSQCQAPKPDVEAFDQEFFKNNPKSDLVKRAKQRGKKKKSKGKYFGGSFMHYADKVTYDFAHFINKNMEKVSPDTQKMLSKAENALIASIMVGKKKPRKRKFVSVTSIFSKALKKLMKTLSGTEPYFIRCVNPNKIKSKTVFVRKVARDQLRSGGILEALRVLSLGYPTRVEYNVLHARYQGRIQNEMVSNLPPNKFAAAVLIAFGVDTDEYELGLTKIFFKPAKAQILEDIMNQDEPLTEEQNQRILDWLAKARINELFGALKLYNYYGSQVRDMRAKVRWEKTSSVVGALGTSLVRFLHHARAQLEARKNKNAAIAIQSYFRAYMDRQAIQKKLKKRRLACKKVWKAYAAYIRREKFMKALTVSVEATREQERLRKEREAARIKAMEAAKAEEDRKAIALQAAIDNLKAWCLRELGDQLQSIVEVAGDEQNALDSLHKTFDEFAARESRKNYQEELAGEVPDVVKKPVIDEMTVKLKDAYAAHQENLRKAKEEAERKKREREEGAKKKAAALEVAKKQQARATQMANEARATAMAKERQERKKQREEQAKDIVEDQLDVEYEDGMRKGQKNLHSLLNQSDSEEEDEEEGEAPHEENAEPEKKEAPFKLDMKLFIRTAGNGTLFRKHKYRRRWDDDARYQPKEVFIKVNFDAENGEPLRITWGTGNRHVEWDTVKLISWGLHTPTYTAMQQRMNLDPKTCFSVVSTHTILDVQNDDTKTVEMWVKGLRHLLGQSGEEADRLSDELRKHPPTTRKRPRRKKEPEPKKRKDRTESLILLQKDLFILTTTTVFRNLEEQYYPITQDIKQEFNPNDMYKLALEEDISWRKWQPWLTEKIINKMRERGLLAEKGGAAAADGSSGGKGKDDKDCVIS
jgi:myosin heavy subunit